MSNICYTADCYMNLYCMLYTYTRIALFIL